MTTLYKFKLVHVPELRHRVADATCRYPTGAIGNKQEILTKTIVGSSRGKATEWDTRMTNEIEQELESEINGYCMAICGETDCEADRMEDVERESAREEDINQLVEAIRQGGTDIETEWNENLNHYKQVRNSLYEKDGMVIYGDKIVIPKILRPRTLEILHSMQ